GEASTLTVTVSGTRGGDHYGVQGVTVDLKVTDSPGPDTVVDPATVTTDASGAATAKLTVSKTKGRNAVTATVGTVTTEFAIDTLSGSTGALTRSRHSGVLDSSPSSAPRPDPMMLFTGAVLVLFGSFAIPYRRRLLGLIRSGRSAKTPFGARDTRASRTAQPTRSTGRGMGWKASSGPGKKT
ncbi:MAG: hypothetical protein QOE92_2130, partial [Chloroflexota bacterium]|nr:hypothetical protein [Chloroflexota bacterium]